MSWIDNYQLRFCWWSHDGQVADGATRWSLELCLAWNKTARWNQPYIRVSTLRHIIQIGWLYE